VIVTLSQHFSHYGTRSDLLHYNLTNFIKWIPVHHSSVGANRHQSSVQWCKPCPNPGTYKVIYWCI